MNLADALEATKNWEAIVETKSGARYSMNRDVLSYVDDDNDYVYGVRVNASPACRFRRGRGAQNGDIRWFHLKSVKLIAE